MASATRRAIQKQTVIVIHAHGEIVSDSTNKDGIVYINKTFRAPIHGMTILHAAAPGCINLSPVDSKIDDDIGKEYKDFLKKDGPMIQITLLKLCNKKCLN